MPRRSSTEPSGEPELVLEIRREDAVAMTAPKKGKIVYVLME